MEKTQASNKLSFVVSLTRYMRVWGILSMMYNTLLYPPPCPAYREPLEFVVSSKLAALIFRGLAPNRFCGLLYSVQLPHFTAF